jgi:quercetin dioxygenase-like cupin family protein
MLAGRSAYMLPGAMAAGLQPSNVNHRAMRRYRYISEVACRLLSLAHPLLFVLECSSWEKAKREGQCMKRLLVIAGIVALAGTAVAQDSAKRMKPEDMEWKGHPLFKIAQSVTLVGDPAKAEVVVVRNKFPANFKVMPHTHPYAEVVTVISGSFGFGMGDKFDPAKGELVKAGSINVVPAKQPHFAWTGNEEAIIQIQYTGPSGIDFINPADDPRKK